jgi:hypothetical protein
MVIAAEVGLETGEGHEVTIQSDDWAGDLLHDDIAMGLVECPAMNG